MIDFQAAAAALYPTMAQNAPGALPVEGKPSIQPPVTKAPAQTPTDTGTPDGADPHD